MAHFAEGRSAPRNCLHQRKARRFTGTSTVGGLQHGTEVKLPDVTSEDGAVYLRRSFTPYVTFDEVVGVGTSTIESQDVLDLCVRMFDDVIIPTFPGFLQDS